MDDLVKSGILFTPCVGLLKIKQKKTWIKKYFALYKRSRSGIERLEIFDNEDAFIKQNNQGVKIIALNECHKVTAAPQKHQPNVFEVRTKDSVHLLSADTFQEMTDWLNCLQLVAFGYNNSSSFLSSSYPNSLNYSVAKVSLDSSANVSLCNNHQHTTSNNNNLNGSSQNGSNGSTFKRVVQEENLLYSSVDAPEIYRLRVLESEATNRCGLRADDTWYYLILTSISISLAEEVAPLQKGSILYVWPFRHIRRYGTIKDGFSFEAGRKCRSGDGLFSFRTKEGNEIFQSVGGHVNSLKSAGLENVTEMHYNDKYRELTRKSSTESKNEDYHHICSSEIKVLPSPTKSSPKTCVINNQDPAKRHSMQLTKSPYTHNGHPVTKMPITRSKTVDDARVLRALPAIVSHSDSSCSSDLEEVKTKVSPPVAKPPRKSKPSPQLPLSDSNFPSTPSSKNSDPLYEDPIFVSREELMLIMTQDKQSSGKESQQQQQQQKQQESNKTVPSQDQEQEQTQTDSSTPSPNSSSAGGNAVTKITSAIRSIFGTGFGIGNSQKRPKNKIKTRSSTSSASSHSSASPSDNSCPQTPSTESDGHRELPKESPVLPAQLESKPSQENEKEVIQRPKSVPVTPENNYENLPPLLPPAPCKHEKTISLGSDYAFIEMQPEHYLQNEVEYARVVKTRIGPEVLKTDI